MWTEAAPRPVHALARVELCGVLTAQIGGRRVETGLPGRKGRLLFACLVVGRQRPMSRDELIDVIWPNESPADPDGAFATLLTRVRTALGPGVLVGRGELALELGPGAWVDWDVARESVGAAEALLASGDAHGALEQSTQGLEIARRPLLPGMSTPWIEDRRRDLVELRAALLEIAGRAALALGGEHLPAAERNARELIEREPYRESAYALLMETHAARGNVAEALRLYDDLRCLLREELGLTPSQPLTQLAERLLAAKGTPAVSPAPVPASSPAPLPPALAAAAARPFAGRGEELARLLDAVLDRSPAAPHVLAVSGDAGIGKTRLAAAAAARAQRAGFDVLHGRGQRDCVTPYRPFVEALRRHLDHDDADARELAPVLGPELAELARVVPELRPALPDGAGAAEPDGRLQRVSDAVAGLCAAAARRRPLLLVLEDLQWTDRDTALVLRELAYATQGGRVSIVVTFRDDASLRPELRALLLDLLREHALERVALSDPVAAAEPRRGRPRLTAVG
jgi:DNA-binding SARP family transcriptional activator